MQSPMALLSGSSAKKFHLRWWIASSKRSFGTSTTVRQSDDIFDGRRGGRHGANFPRKLRGVISTRASHTPSSSGERGSQTPPLPPPRMMGKAPHIDRPSSAKRTTGSVVHGHRRWPRSHRSARIDLKNLKAPDDVH